MISGIVLVLSGIWQIYNFFTVIYDLPYVQIFPEGVYLGGLNAICLKWSLPIGFCSIIVGGLTFFLRDKDVWLGKMFLVVSIFISVCLIF